VFDKINATFQFHQEALSLRHERQKVLANNIANADTPGFKARDMDFSKALSTAVSRHRTDQQGAALTRTSAHHLTGNQSSTDIGASLKYRVPTQPSMDGNTVDMDTERTQFADNSVRYQASLVMINSYIKGLKTAMQSE